MNHTYYDPEAALATGDRTSGFSRIFNWTACARDVRKEGPIELGFECTGQVQDIGWIIEDYETNAGAGGVISCPKDMVSSMFLTTIDAVSLTLYRSMEIPHV